MSDERTQHPVRTERETQIRERLKAATPGPWKQFSGHVGGKAGYICAAAEPSGNYVPTDFKPVELWSERFEEAINNAALIANAPSDLEWALSQLDAVRAELAKESARLDWLQARIDDRNVTGGPTNDICFSGMWGGTEIVEGDVSEAVVLGHGTDVRAAIDDAISLAARGLHFSPKPEPIAPPPPAARDFA